MTVKETWLVETTKDIELDIDPHDYLWCSNENELMDAIREDLSCSADGYNVEKWIEPIDFYIDENFIKQWIKLKEHE